MTLLHSTQASHRKRKLIVLDDDPTGTQTVSQVSVLLEPSLEDLMRDEAAVFVLTNSRALDRASAERLATKLGDLLRQVQLSGKFDLRIVSRSDSTLRGHFPAELIALQTALQQNFDATILCPVFLDGGRITKGDVHYIRANGMDVPVGESEFARDRSFSYSSSNLPEWVREKWGPGCPIVHSISLEEIRSGRALEALMACPPGAVVIPNAESREDLELFVGAVLASEKDGCRYLFRTAADWVSVYSGLPKTETLAAAEIAEPTRRAGLVVVGSYVDQTTRQLQNLLENVRCEHIQIGLGTDRDHAAHRIDQSIAEGIPVVVSTVRDRDKAGDLTIGRAYSDLIVSILQSLEVRPAYVVSKGGITSSDVAKEVLGMRRAWVTGRALPGVPVWKSQSEGHWPGISLVVFPGNVGSVDSLTTLIQNLEQARTSATAFISKR